MQFNGLFNRLLILVNVIVFDLSTEVFCMHTERSGCEVVELNVQADHVHLLVKVPPKISISTLVGQVKGKTAIQVFQEFC